MMNACQHFYCLGLNSRYENIKLIYYKFIIVICSLGYCFKNETESNVDKIKQYIFECFNKLEVVSRVISLFSSALLKGRLMPKKILMSLVLITFGV
jgi:hypothetical protein